jgi:hypothetical protein
LQRFCASLIALFIAECFVFKIHKTVKVSLIANGNHPISNTSFVTFSQCTRVIAPRPKAQSYLCLLFFSWARILSNNPFELQLKINSDSITPSDYYIGPPFGDSQHFNEWKPENSSAVHEFESYKCSDFWHLDYKFVISRF